MVQKGINWVKVDDIAPHPDNPRKDLGDLTELADSIKENGVLQNLTLVPHPDKTAKTPYMAVIGHRRLAGRPVYSGQAPGPLRHGPLN